MDTETKKPRLLLILLLSLNLIVFILSAYLFYQNSLLKQQLSALSHNPANTQALIPPPHWQVYQHPDEPVFEFKYPPDLEISVSDDNNNPVTPKDYYTNINFIPSGSDPTSYALLTVDVTDKYKNLNDYLNNKWCGERLNYSNAAEISNTWLDNQPAKKIVCNEVALPSLNIVTMKGDYIYRIQVLFGSAHLQYYSQSETERLFSQVVSSFKFLESIPGNSPSPIVSQSCKIGGCSGTICQDADAEPMITTCEWKDEYACYKNAICEKQSNGKCGWTQTPTFTACLQNSSL